ncbi:MAG: hypothetical protein DRQ47_07180, partial [Gammaproteobacteria bacterium]
MKYTNLNQLLIIALFTTASFTTFAKEAEEKHDSEDEQGVVEIAENSNEIYKVKVAKLRLYDIAREITSPGEVVLNSYKTGIVALRIDGQIIKRLSKMGESVTQGQPMAIISSVQMSEA